MFIYIEHNCISFHPEIIHRKFYVGIRKCGLSSSAEATIVEKGEHIRAVFV